MQYGLAPCMDGILKKKWTEQFNIKHIGMTFITEITLFGLSDML